MSEDFPMPDRVVADMHAELVMLFPVLALMHLPVMKAIEYGVSYQWGEAAWVRHGVTWGWGRGPTCVVSWPTPGEMGDEVSFASLRMKLTVVRGDRIEAPWLRYSVGHYSPIVNDRILRGLDPKTGEPLELLHGS